MSAYTTVARCWWLLGQHRWVGECLGSSSQLRCVKKNEKYHVLGKNIPKDRFIINDVNRLNQIVEWLVGILSAYFNIKQQTSRARTDQNPHAWEGGRGSRYGGRFGAYKSEKIYIYIYTTYFWCPEWLSRSLSLSLLFLFASLRLIWKVQRQKFGLFSMLQFIFIFFCKSRRSMGGWPLRQAKQLATASLLQMAFREMWDSCNFMSPRKALNHSLFPWLEWKGNISVQSPKAWHWCGVGNVGHEQMKSATVKAQSSLVILHGFWTQVLCWSLPPGGLDGFDMVCIRIWSYFFSGSFTFREVGLNWQSIVYYWSLFFTLVCQCPILDVSCIHPWGIILTKIIVTVMLDYQFQHDDVF